MALAYPQGKKPGTLLEKLDPDRKPGDLIKGPDWKSSISDLITALVAPEVMGARISVFPKGSVLQWLYEKGMLGRKRGGRPRAYPPKKYESQVVEEALQDIEKWLSKHPNTPSEEAAVFRGAHVASVKGPSEGMFFPVTKRIVLKGGKSKEAMRGVRAHERGHRVANVLKEESPFLPAFLQRRSLRETLPPKKREAFARAARAVDRIVELERDPRGQEALAELARHGFSRSPEMADPRTQRTFWDVVGPLLERDLMPTKEGW